MSFVDTLLGKPLATSEEHTERIGVAAGVPIFGLDALTSAAYGPEAAMTLLIPLGLAGLQYIVPIVTAVLILLGIVFFSYLQTIAAYPNGGGSYTVANENLGTGPALLAAAALMIDYILTAAVGISAGVNALTSAVPSLQPDTVLLCLVILAILSIVNLRGVKEAGAAFIVPTFMFVGTLIAVIGFGVYHTILAHGHPVPVVAPPPALPATVKYLGIWLLLKSFSNGCAAMTGVEAVSNGVNAFAEPRAKKAQTSLAIIIGMLVILLFGTTYLARAYGITAMEPDAYHYQTMVSILTTAVFGRGWFYYVTMGSILVALSISANTAFAGFPRLARAIAANEYLPHVFLLRGRRLLFSHGIYALTGFTAVIIFLFDGVTDKLIPLYAIGAFIAFTLSQAGMVVHWRKQEGGYKKHWWHMFVNGFGALATGITTLVVLVTKFTSGAWVTALLIPVLILIMLGVKKHYSRVRREMKDMTPLNLVNLEPPIVVIPMARWDRVTEKALRFGLLLSKEIKAVHIHSDDEGDEGLEGLWGDKVLGPIRKEGLDEPELVTIASNFRFVLSPLMDYILKLEDDNPGRKVAVILPEMVVRHWWEYALHGQRVQLLKLMLLLKGNQRIVLVNIPWYL
jgi:amino acid transporter